MNLRISVLWCRTTRTTMALTTTTKKTHAPQNWIAIAFASFFVPSTSCCCAFFVVIRAVLYQMVFINKLLRGVLACSGFRACAFTRRHLPSNYFSTMTFILSTAWLLPPLPSVALSFSLDFILIMFLCSLFKFVCLRFDWYTRAILSTCHIVCRGLWR